MPASITFFPLGNADCLRLDLADTRKVLIDFGNQGNPSDPYDRRCNLAEELKSDLRSARRDYFDVVCFTHLDADHCDGAGDFFSFRHADKFQGDGRIKINELWVPAAAVTEEGLDDCARVIRQEARFRLREGKGIRVFSRPEHLRDWMQKAGIDFESRKHLITDAGQYVPGYSVSESERVQFFVHSPFALRQNGNEIIDRNQDSVVLQAAFRESLRDTYVLLMSDIDHESIEQIVLTSKQHRNDDRLLWDVFKIPHHCSYTAVGPDKGDDETNPTVEVKWLCENQGRERSTMISTSKSIPFKDSAEDKDVQPPHRQAAAYYKRVASAKDGLFKVTMDLPSASRPRPTTIEITDRGARQLTVSATVGAASIISTPARAG